MAIRRMCSKELYLRDDFLSMPDKLIKLYLYLNLSADDEGFVGNPRGILGMLHMKNKPLDELCERGLLILFPSGVALIRHWFLHNQIKSDRFTPTVYLDERAAVTQKHKIYYLEKPSETPEKEVFLVDNLDPQYRTVERSEEKDSIDQSSREKDNAPASASEDESEYESRPRKRSYYETLSDESRRKYEGILTRIRIYFMKELPGEDGDGFIKYNESRYWNGMDPDEVEMHYKHYADEWSAAGRRHDERVYGI